MLFDFGQPTDGIFQTAFVVEDLDAADRAVLGAPARGSLDDDARRRPAGRLLPRRAGDKPQCTSGSGSPDTCCTN